MLRVPFRLVDVFAERPLEGNQLCVVPDPVPLDDAAMMALTREIAFSETTFVSSASADRYRMRIFTPAGELPFAGHPTLGTAFVMVSEKRVTSPVRQETAAGEVRVEVDLAGHAARMRPLPPTWGAEARDLGAVAAAVGLTTEDLRAEWRPQVAATGVRHLLVAAASGAAVARAVPDYARLTPLLAGVDANAVYLFALTPEGAKARRFDRSPQMGEDPATGSAAGPVGVYLAMRGAAGMPARLAIHQGEEVGRPSVLHVEVSREGDGWSVVVGGGVYIVGEGAFSV